MRLIPVLLVLFAALFSSPLSAEEAKPLRHIVCLKFKEGTSAEEITAIEKGFLNLEKEIETIIGFEWGPFVNKGPNTKGFTHCFVVTFADQAGLDAYLPHPAHQAFVIELKKVMDEVFVADFVVQ